jgi:hypothetical protein
MNDSARGRTPTLWIAAAALFALAAIGFAIAYFSTKSDLDDADATIERQKQQLAAAEGAATSEEQRLTAFGRRERAAYRRVRRRLINEQATAAELQKKVRDEAAGLEQARQEVSDAQSESAKRAARLEQARAETRLAVACSASAVDALNRFVDAATPRAGAAAAVNQLQATQEECTRASED